MVQILYLSKRAHPDIQLEASFLCTIVIWSNTDDYKNMEREMKYIQVTIGLPLILSINNSVNIKWYVDANLSVHKDMKSHTG